MVIVFCVILINPRNNLHLFALKLTYLLTKQWDEELMKMQNKKGSHKAAKHGH